MPLALRSRAFTPERSSPVPDEPPGEAEQARKGSGVLPRLIRTVGVAAAAVVLLGAAPSVAVPSLLSEALSFAALARAPSRSAVEFVSFRFHYQHDGQRVFGVNDGGSDLEIREIDRHGVVTRAYVVGSMLYFESTDQGWYRFDEAASYRRLLRTHPALRASAGSASHPDLTLRSLPDRIVGGRVFGAW